MGKPDRKVTAQAELTWGSETSQYPEENTSIEIPLVAASERGGADQICCSGTHWEVWP